MVTTTSLSNSEEILHSLQAGSVFDSSNSHSIVKIPGFSGVIGHPIDVLSIICSYFQQQVQHVLNGRYLNILLIVYNNILY